MPHITKEVWHAHAPSAQELLIPRVPTRTMLAVALAWLVVGATVNQLASTLWGMIAP
jgi:hypothetical protein